MTGTYSRTLIVDNIPALNFSGTTGADTLYGANQDDSIFGVDGQSDAPIRSVNAALETLAMIDRLKPFFASMYGIDFDIRIGINYGEAVIGTLGFARNERLTAIGDVVNLASRVEAANKDAGTRLLISEALRDEIADMHKVIKAAGIKRK